MSEVVYTLRNQRSFDPLCSIRFDRSEPLATDLGIDIETPCLVCVGPRFLLGGDCPECFDAGLSPDMWDVEFPDFLTLNCPNCALWEERKFTLTRGYHGNYPGAPGYCEVWSLPTFEEERLCFGPNNADSAVIMTVRSINQAKCLISVRFGFAFGTGFSGFATQEFNKPIDFSNSLELTEYSQCESSSPTILTAVA